MLFVSGGDTSEVLYTIEEALDAVAFPIEGVAEACLPASVLFGGNVWRGAFGFDGATQPVGVICLVGEHDGSGLQPGEQFRRLRAIAGLTGRDHQFQRQARRVDQCMNLGGQASARAAHTAIRVTFLSWRHADALGSRCCRSFGYHRRKPLIRRS